jgi:hypothetical protein
MAIVNSKVKWNNTGINLVAGRKYHYQAIGKWKDWYFECDANGYSNTLMDLASLLKRVPTAKWFQLVGAVDKDASHFIKLGSSGTFIAPVSGRLWAFANDAWFAYCNNSGSVELEIQNNVQPNN